MRGIICLGICTILFFADQAHAQRQIGSAPLCGVPVYVTNEPLGMRAVIDYNGSYILVDNRVYAEFRGSGFFRFMLGHECAHFELGHSTSGNIYQQELDADCWSAQRVAIQDAQEAIRYFLNRQGAFAGAPGYPTGNQRAATIRQCSNRFRRR